MAAGVADQENLPTPHRVEPYALIAERQHQIPVMDQTTDLLR